jgi:RimJ/RimL family protein N-acetyltransferase
MSPSVERYSAAWHLPLDRPLAGDALPRREGRALDCAPARELALAEPTLAEVQAAAAQLSTDYNDPINRALMTNESDMSPAEVVEMFQSMWKRDGRPFLLRADRSLVGDCDLRRVDAKNRTAEFAIMVAPRSLQGRGLGTRFSIMVLAVAFGPLGLAHVYASVRPENGRSIRMFERVGYERDESPAARSYAEHPDEICFSINSHRFRRLHVEALGHIRIAAISDGARSA